ncbi:hypothetical protein EIP91_011756 [Steccherinum ochraceum]|uniref:DUF676 domain-containing protein n=1 Tax=Steccherinum ochraceum TaxID=92696 RepID=A0A4R0RPA9_9APHY|nr:hypothetical protein EIP91_011756 [Steccherinum ochraceum]
MTASKKVHLLVLIHGMWGNPTHLTEMFRIYNETIGPAADESRSGPDGEELHVIVPETNKDSATYDGIDWGGERVTEEIYEEVKKLAAEGKTVTRFSITGYSLGGLIGRYVVGILMQKDFFESVTPVNFSTVATPHLGQVLTKTFLSKTFAFFGPKLLSRTGKQLYAQDKWAGSGKPLLDNLADSGLVFYKALSSFQRVRFYANAINDVTVPYLTAAAATSDPFPGYSYSGLKIEINGKYAPIIESFTPPETPKPKPPGPRPFTKPWFRSLEPRLPPILQFKYPANLVIYVLLPVLVPVFFSMIMVRLSLEKRDSIARLKVLESDESYRERLVHVVGQLEKTIEDAAIDIMESPEPQSGSGSSQTLLHVGPASSSPPPEGSSKPTAPSPFLSPRQLQIAETLSRLPNLKKELAFIDQILNSHAVIVARDVQRFEHHRRGQGVLQHLADNFVM